MSANTGIYKTAIDRPFTFCPRCGQSGLALHEKWDYRCSLCGFHFFMNAAGAVAALITDTDGRLLLTRRKHPPAAGALDLPGGFIEPGESAEAALTREVWEELHLRLNGWRYIGSTPNRYRFKDLTVFTVDLAFSCTVETFDGLKSGDDVADVAFIPPDAVPLAEIGLESIRRIICSYRDRLRI